MKRRWVELLDFAAAMLREHPRLVDVPIRLTAEIHEAPTGAEVIGLTDITASKGDGLERLHLQVDQWAADRAALMEMTDAVAEALDHNIEVIRDGVRFTCVWDDGRGHADSEEGAAHRSDDFVMEAVWKR